MRTRVFLNPSQNVLVGAYPDTAEHVHVVCDSTNAAFSVRLPDLLNVEHREIIFYNLQESGAGHDVTVQAVAGQIINTADSEHVLHAGDTVTFVSDLKKRWILSDVNIFDTNHVVVSNLTPGYHPYATADLSLADGPIYYVTGDGSELAFIFPGNNVLLTMNDSPALTNLYTPLTIQSALRLYVQSDNCIINSVPSLGSVMFIAGEVPYPTKLGSAELGSTTNYVGVGYSGNMLLTGYTSFSAITSDMLVIENAYNSEAMIGTGTGILFSQWYYDATTPAEADSGRIAVITETDWTSTASTRDSYMSFQTALNGTVAEKMALSSSGNLSVVGTITAVGATLTKNRSSSTILNIINTLDSPPTGDARIQMSAHGAVLDIICWNHDLLNYVQLSTGTRMHIISPSVTIDGGLNVGGSTAPGDNNLSVVGTIQCGGVLSSSSGRIVKTTRVTAGPYTVLATDHHINCQTTGGAFAALLPAGVAGTEYNFYNTGTANLTITPNGAELLKGSNTSVTLYPTEVLRLVYFATEGWM
jgi:hypothetical protein